MVLSGLYYIKAVDITLHGRRLWEIDVRWR